MADPALERERPPTSGSSATAPPQRADEIFLEGPRSRFDELITLFRVLLDFLRGFRVLHFVGPCVTVFGSARIKEGHPSYELARKMGAAIAQLGFTVMTGGGPGVATETISVYIYKITQQDLIWGYVAAIALVILIVLSVLVSLAISRMNAAKREAVA